MGSSSFGVLDNVRECVCVRECVLVLVYAEGMHVCNGCANVCYTDVCNGAGTI